MDQLTSLISNVLAVLLIVGGIYGFITAQSVISLATGLISGILLFVANQIANKKPKDGYIFICAISLVLAIFFAIKFAANHALMPHGLMLVLSTTTLVITGLNLFKKK